MSTFYLLPPRPVLGERLAGFLQSILPGLDWDTSTRIDLAETVDAAVSRHANVFVVYRDELPEGEPPVRALADGFGAAAGDEVVEVRAGARAGEMTARRWKVA